MRRVHGISILLVLGVLLCGERGPAQPCPGPAGGWGWGSSLGDFYIQGSHAYYGSGTMMVALDVSDPVHPVQTHAVALPGKVTRMAFSGRWGYVGVAERGIAVVDLSSPDIPMWTGSIYPVHFPLDVKVFGDHLLVADVYSGLRVLNIEDPVSPSEVAFLAPPEMPMDIVIVGERAFVTDYERGVLCVDLADPLRPNIVGSYHPGDAPTALSANGQWVYVAAGYEGLHVLDWDDAGQPILAKVLEWPNFVCGFTQSGTIGYLFGWDQFAVVDMSSPEAPLQVATWQGTDGMTALTIKGNLGYLCDDYLGWFVLDLCSPASPQIIGHWVHGGHMGHPTVQDGLLLVPQMMAGWRVFDLSVPSAPRPISFQPDPGYITHIEVERGHAYLLVQDEGVLIYDIADPARPVPLGLYRTTARSLLADKGILYLGSERGLRILNILNPAQPTLMGWINFSGGCPGSLWISGSFAFCGHYDVGIQIVDIASPAAPIALGYYSIAGGLSSNITGEGSFLYYSSDYRRLNVLDVSNPADPQLAGSLAGWEWPTVVHAKNGRIVVSDEFLGLCVVEVRDPDAPRLQGCRSTMYGIGSVEVDGNWVYVGTYSAGLAAYTLDGCAEHRRPTEKPHE